MPIYVDIDGVCADFNGWLRQYIPELNEDMWRNNRTPILDMMATHIDRCFIDSRPLHMLEYFSHLYTSSEYVVFLSAAPAEWENSDLGIQAERNKATWLANHIPNFDPARLICTNGHGGKLAFAAPGAVLYDDMQRTITQWNAKGGFGFHTVGMPVV